MDVYVDVLLVLSGYVNYFLLRAAARLLHLAVRTPRCILGAAVGSLFSLTIFLPQLPLLLCVLLRLCAAWFTVRLGFGRIHSLREPAAFVLVSVAFGGGMLALLLLVRPAGFAMRNGNIYLSFSPLMLVLFTAGAYGVTCLLRRVLDKNGRSTGRYTVLIRAGTKLVALEGLADTGNGLVDAFTGRAVIVCGRERLSQLTELPSPAQAPTAAELCTRLAKTLRGVRLLPYATVSDGGVMPIFRPDEVIIREESTNRRKQVDACIGIGETDTAAIFNPKLLL